MRDVVYFASISIDGFIDSADGDSSWVVPDPELHRHFNELERTVDTHLEALVGNYQNGPVAEHSQLIFQVR